MLMCVKEARAGYKVILMRPLPAFPITGTMFGWMSSRRLMGDAHTWGTRLHRDMLIILSRNPGIAAWRMNGEIIAGQSHG